MIITYNTINTTFVITPIKAPLPHDLAFKGNVAFQVSHKIKPITGIKKPKGAKPPLGALFTIAEFFDVSADYLIGLKDY